MPDLIATSKFKSYAWQDEFRLLFTLTDAFNVDNHESVRPAANPAEHHQRIVNAGDLNAICRLIEF